MKRHIDDLAIFGGPRLFNSPRPIGQLSAPPFDDFLAIFREVYDARRLTNDGPLVRRLEQQLAEYHGVMHCIAVANAGIGIMMLIQLFAGSRRGEVIMPAFTYYGLPHYAQWAGQIPRFCDVDPNNHVLDPPSVAAAINERTTSILGVCAFNSPGNLKGLSEVAERYGVPLFLDSVDGMASSYHGRRLGGFTRAEVYSLHATKLLNGFEGGYITTNDTDLNQRLRWQRCFSLPGLEPGLPNTQHIMGLNGKLNEMHAAMALASFTQLQAEIKYNTERYYQYQEDLSGIDGLSLLPYPEGEDANYRMAVVKVEADWPLSRDNTVRILRAEGALISAYYSPPLHRSDHCPVGLSVPSLPVSERLSREYIQLSVGAFTSVADVREICRLLQYLQQHGQEIESRLYPERMSDQRTLCIVGNT